MIIYSLLRGDKLLGTNSCHANVLLLSRLNEEWLSPPACQRVKTYREKTFKFPNFFTFFCGMQKKSQQLNTYQRRICNCHAEDAEMKARPLCTPPSFLLRGNNNELLIGEYSSTREQMINVRVRFILCRARWEALNKSVHHHHSRVNARKRFPFMSHA